MGKEKMKVRVRVVLLVLLIATLLLSACRSSTFQTASPPLVTQTTSNTGAPTLMITKTVAKTISPMTFTVRSTITPEITATPVMIESKDVGEVIRKLFPFFASTKCTLDILKTYSITYSKPVLQTSDFDGDPFHEYEVKEIAYNQSHSMLAFVAFKDSQNVEEQLFLNNINAGTTTEIKWSPRPYLRGPIGNIIWIGDTWLVFMEQDGITSAKVFVIDIEKMKFILNLVRDNRCEP